MRSPSSASGISKAGMPLADTPLEMMVLSWSGSRAESVGRIEAARSVPAPSLPWQSAQRVWKESSPAAAARVAVRTDITTITRILALISTCHDTEDDSLILGRSWMPNLGVFGCFELTAGLADAFAVFGHNVVDINLFKIGGAKQ